MALATNEYIVICETYRGLKLSIVFASDGSGICSKRPMLSGLVTALSNGLGRGGHSQRSWQDFLCGDKILIPVPQSFESLV